VTPADFTFAPEAVQDVREYYAFIAKDSVTTANRFMDATYDACQKLAEMPGMGALRDVKNRRLLGLRSWPIKGFENFLIFYLPSPQGIEVTRVLHGARDIDAIFSA